MEIDVVIEDPRWVDADLAGLASTAFRATLKHLDLADADWECAVLACDDTRIADLNRDFRDRPTPTNVLSWPSEERGADHPGAVPQPPDATDPELGDIAIAFDTCAREARAGGKPLADHVTHLIVHAVLHLLGYDHERDEDATLMEGLETSILAELGLPDPYE